MISTWLYPADLEGKHTGDPLPGCHKLDLPGMTDDDALNLWRAFGVSGTRDVFLPVFQSCGKYPLLIQALAGEIKRDKRARGDFERWQRSHPRFDPMTLPNVENASAHVLEFALRGRLANAVPACNGLASRWRLAAWASILWLRDAIAARGARTAPGNWPTIGATSATSSGPRGCKAKQPWH